MIRQCTVKPVWISHALKRRPCSDGQARLMLSVFYMLSFHAFIKRKTVKRTLIQTDNIFIPQIKKHPALRGHKWKFRNFDKHRIKLDISDNFIKKKHFLHFKQHKIFLDFSLQFWKSATLLTRTLHLLFHIALCNQLTIVFAPLKAISIFEP